MEWTDLRLINLSSNTVCMGIISILIISSLVLDRSNYSINKTFTLVLLTILLHQASEFINWFYKGNTSAITLLYVSNWVQFLLGFLEVGAFAAYLYIHLSHEKASLRLFPIIVLFFVLTDIGILVSSIWTDSVFTIDAAGFYHRGSLYLLTQIFALAVSLMSIVIVLIHSKRLGDKTIVFLVCYAIIPIACLVVQIFAYGIALLDIGNTLCCVLLFMSVQNQQAINLQKLNMELIEDKIQLFQSQISPHFITNVLLAIRDLCEKDTLTALKVIDDFTAYLRYNLDSLYKNEAVPISEELSHTEKYLRLEKIRFDGAVNWQFDIQSDEFCLPALTIQPLVENAVRHGILKNQNGGMITIKIKKEKDHYLITIHDSGPGFDIKAYLHGHGHGHGHVGIENVRHRIEMRMGGSLDLFTSSDKGTIASIIIPFKK
ncbi:MAG: histidine kinase [Spirochaetaceae bacterium]|jgi:sensor histidine kinase YesM|nr:histidine kinase [Spirochaetaceae bacterium]